MSVVSDTLFRDLFLFYPETKNSNPAFSVIRLIRFFPEKGRRQKDEPAEGRNGWREYGGIETEGSRRKAALF